MSLRVHHAILHILDNSVGIPVLSQREMELTLEIAEFLENRILKIIEDDNVKKSFFREPVEIFETCKGLSTGEISFLDASITSACKLFDIMTQNVEILPADLICCIFEYEGVFWYGMLKLNYKQGLTHFVDQGDEGNINTIISHRTLLPADGQRVEEAVLINLSDFSILLVEKEYLINGQKDKYLSGILLGCETKLSNKEKVKILDKVTKKINKKYFDEDLEQVTKVKKAIAESMDSNEEAPEVNIVAVADKCFGDKPEIREEYMSEIFKAGIQETSIQVPEKVVDRKYRVHKIRTDTGVEINFPSEYYDNIEKLEFLNNPNGTISIIIKNVGHIENK